MKKLENKITLVTGAASGIGKACALEAAREGATVVLGDLERGNHDAALAEVRAISPDSIFVPMDVSSEESVASAIQSIVDKFGRLDVAINNAGISEPSADLHEMDLSVWNRVVGVNLTGVFLCCKHELQQFLKQGGGVIVNMASVAGLRAIPEKVHYTSTKHGAIGITKVIAARYGDKNIRANVVCPYYTETPMIAGADHAAHDYWVEDTPMHRLSTAEEIAKPTIFYASDGASFCNGGIVVIDGGKCIK